jgi:hypothetical protein
MHRYRIQVTIPGDRIAAVIEAVYKDPVQYDPELKVWPFELARPGLALEAIAHPVAPKPAKTKRRQTHIAGGKRQTLVEAALKEGPKRWGELRTALAAGGISESSLNSLIANWQKNGKIARSPDGLWSLVEQQNAEGALV